MADKTKIEWTDASWNPVRGCSRVSEGCRNCYAEAVAARFSDPGQAYERLAKRTPNGPRWTGEVRFVKEHLEVPIRWKRPRKIFVNSMSDLFHESISITHQTDIFEVMAKCPQHTFQVLTKRAENLYRLKDIGVGVAYRLGQQSTPNFWPLLNVWIGVSVEDQKSADERIPYLLNTPAAVRFISAEPLLGPTDITRFMWPVHWHWDGRYKSPQEAIEAGAYAERKRQGLVYAGARFLDWVIVGGESGHGARPMHPDWARSLRDQCASAGVKYFFKQWGEAVPLTQMQEPLLAKGKRAHWFEGSIIPSYFVGKKNAGRFLDGRTWDEFPNQ